MARPRAHSGCRHTVGRHRSMLLSQLCLYSLVLLPRMCSAGLPQLLLNTPDAWPEYTRGKDNYKWVFSKRALDNGLTYLGSHERLKAVIKKIKEGAPTIVSTLGGSITAGQGCGLGHSWPQYFSNYLQDYYGTNVGLSNGAVGGTHSAYMSVCLNVHVPKNADLVFVEYNQNDHGVVQPLFMNSARKHFERLLRKLLALPNKPAVVLLHSYSWLMPQQDHQGTFWFSAEREMDEFAHYYGLPTLSVKSSCHGLMREGALGFWVNATRSKDEQGLGKKAFYYDIIHPDGETGARVMAELAMHLIDTVSQEVASSPLSASDQAAIDLPLPAPMIPNNYQSVNDTCFIATRFTGIVTKKEGFEWVNESKGPRSKWGMVATQVGSVLEMTVDSQASAGGNAAGEVQVELAYLQSYEHMGKASVSCVSGCTCEPATMEGHTSHKSSQLTLISVYVSQHPQCVIQVKVLADTSSGEHKVKVSGLMISEEPGRAEGIRNNQAVEYVHDVIASSKSATFDVNNHVRRQFRRLIETLP